MGKIEFADSHKIVDVTWDGKVLKRRGYPQTVYIRTKEYWDYNEMYNHNENMNLQNRSWVYDKIPDNLEGELLYKDITWDFMYASFSEGLIAAVREKVVKIFEEIGISKDEYVFKPIKIKGVDLTYYLLFIKKISEDEISLKDSKMRLHSAPSISVTFNSHQEKMDFEELVTYTAIAIPKRYQEKDIIFVDGTIHCFFSQRLIDAFERHNVKGFEVFSDYIPELKFI